MKSLFNNKYKFLQKQTNSYMHTIYYRWKNISKQLQLIEIHVTYIRTINRHITFRDKYSYNT